MNNTQELIADDIIDLQYYTKMYRYTKDQINTHLIKLKEKYPIKEWRVFWNNNEDLHDKLLKWATN